MPYCPSPWQKNRKVNHKIVSLGGSLQFLWSRIDMGGPVPEEIAIKAKNTRNRDFVTLLRNTAPRH